MHMEYQLSPDNCIILRALIGFISVLEHTFLHPTYAHINCGPKKKPVSTRASLCHWPSVRVFLLALAHAYFMRMRREQMATAAFPSTFPLSAMRHTALFHSALWLFVGIYCMQLTVPPRA